MVGRNYHSQPKSARLVEPGRMDAIQRGANNILKVGGHEGVGVIVKMGPGTENSDVKVGDRVGIKWLADVCGSCREPCLASSYHLCDCLADKPP